MDTIVVYTAVTGNRLRYVLDWLFKEQLQLDYKITNEEKDISGLPFFISYGKPVHGSFSIPAKELLSETGAHKTEPTIGIWKRIPTIFASGEEGYSLPFDLFSAIFYLLSRYEEYYSYKPDKHGRYPAGSSIIYKNGWLLRPVVDEWVYAFGKLLHADYGIHTAERHFTFRPTYDIDMAYSYRYKDSKRTFGAFARDMMRGNFKLVSERANVLRGKQKDPYDSFRWLRQLHKQYDCKPAYFVLAAGSATAFDKNLAPTHPAMVRIIRNLARDGEVGLHPSYYCLQGDTLSEEAKALGHVAGHSITLSRQHYIRMKLPDTYRLLLKQGIAHDYSMGYGTHLGFRAGTGNSFPWYDIEQETATSLRVHPFCFMDTTARFEQKLSASAAFEQLNTMSKPLEKTGSVMTTIFHNFSLGTDPGWKGWRQAYEHFVHEKAQGNSAE